MINHSEQAPCEWHRGVAYPSEINDAERAAEAIQSADDSRNSSFCNVQAVYKDAITIVCRRPKTIVNMSQRGDDTFYRCIYHILFCILVNHYYVFQQFYHVTLTDKMVITSLVGEVVKYCNEHVCVCLSAVCEHIFRTTSAIFTKFFCAWPWLGPSSAG